jgi:hypothetical protein
MFILPAYLEIYSQNKRMGLWGNPASWRAPEKQNIWSAEPTHVGDDEKVRSREKFPEDELQCAKSIKSK